MHYQVVRSSTGTVREPTVRVSRAPNGIRTRATDVKGRRPRPLDDEGEVRVRTVRNRLSIEVDAGVIQTECPGHHARSRFGIATETQFVAEHLRSA